MSIEFATRNKRQLSRESPLARRGAASSNLPFMPSSHTSIDEDAKGTTKHSETAPIDGKKELDQNDMIGAVGATWKEKLTVVLTTLFLTFGANYTLAALPVLKPVILKNTYYRGHLIDNAKYGVMTSASNLINTVLPFFSGVLVDVYGPSYIALFCSTCIAVGNLVLSLGASRGEFNMINGGEILMGIGNVTIHMCQLKIYAHWFRGSTVDGPGLLGLVTGFDVAIGRVFGLMGALIPAPLMEATGKWYWGLWLGFIFSIFAWALCLVYVLHERTLPASRKIAQSMLHRRCMSPWQHVTAFLGQFWDHVVQVPAAFWILILVQLLQTGAVASYESNTVDMMVVTRGEDNVASLKSAAYKYSMHYAIPIVLTPIVGLGFDKLGYRSAAISVCACFYIIAMSLMGFSQVHPVVPMLFDAFGYTLNSVPFLATVPLLVRRQTLMGSAHGILKAFNASGETIMQVAGGSLQDRAVRHGKPMREKYDYMLYLVLTFKGLEALYGGLYHALDRRYFGGVMRMTEKQRVKKEAELGEQSYGSLCRPHAFWTVLGCVTSVLIVAAAYGVFIHFWITNPDEKPGTA